jgi:hypothetical protein
MRKPYRVRALMALALAVLTLAAACGDDGADVRDVGDTTTGSTGTGSGTGTGTGTGSGTGTTTSGATTETEPTTTG